MMGKIVYVVSRFPKILETFILHEMIGIYGARNAVLLFFEKWS
jgi:hypothetical protein